MVAIKDMEMPSCCFDNNPCLLANGETGTCNKLEFQEDCDTTEKRPSDCPLVEIEERKGKWIKYNTTEKFDMFGDRVKVSSYKCSECGRIISDISEDGFTNKLQDYPYCHCGAEMRGCEE